MSPAVKGISPSEPATQTKMEFSAGENGVFRRLPIALNRVNPIIVDGRFMPVMKPVCSPKYTFAKRISTPTNMPTVIVRADKAALRGTILCFGVASGDRSAPPEDPRRATGGV